MNVKAEMMHQDRRRALSLTCPQIQFILRYAFGEKNLHSEF